MTRVWLTTDSADPKLPASVKVVPTNLQDADFGDFSVSSGVATLENIPTPALLAAAQAGRLDQLNARWFGAVGNGTTDDTAAIQATIDSLPLNTADTGVLSPKGFANGGTVVLPRGRYVVSGTITLKRGIRIVGEGRESTQIVSRTAGNVFHYPDAGRYIQDEIVFENLSIWQAADVTATSGAAINVGFGAASVQSTKVIIRNVYVEGTYLGYRLDAGVGSIFEAADASQCVSHGFDVRYTDGSNTASTTSTNFTSCYASLNGGDGFHILYGAYCGWNGCASDSNTGYGYYFEGGQAHRIHGGAEANTAGGVQLKDTTGITLDVNVVQASGAMHGITLDNAINTALLGGVLSSGGTGYAIHRITARRLVVIGTEFLSNWATNRVDSNSQLLILSDIGGLIGQANQWGIGVAQDVDTTSTLVVGGSADAATATILKVNGTHTAANATRNVGVHAQVITANTAVTYPLVAGLYVPNASKGAASTITRTNGAYIAQQDVGTNNTNLFLDAGAGAAPAGNWALVSLSTRHSILSGPLRMGGSTGPLWTSGAGTPEGAVTAPIGSLFSRTDGGAGTSFYVKESGTGNTGWVGK